MRIRTLLLPLLVLLPSACVVTSLAKTAVDVVSLPVKVVSKGVDLATTSQSEADEKRGRQLREEGARCARGRPLPTDFCPSAQTPPR